MQMSAASRVGADTVAHAPRSDGLPTYTLPDDALEMGASLGNSSVWVDTLGTGAVQRVFDVRSGETVVNSICIRYACRGRHQGADDGRGAGTAFYAGLRQETPGTFELHPAYQRHSFTIAGFIHVAETLVVPLLGAGPMESDPPLVYQVVELRNDDALDADVRVVGYARLRGGLDDDVEARYDAGLGALVARNASRPALVRVFGATEQPSGYATSFDYSRVYSPLHVRPLENNTEARGDVLGCIQLDTHIPPGETRSFAFVTAISSEGETPAIAAFRAGLDFGEALTGTIRHLSSLLSHGHVMTPDPQVNQGALWSKVNMVRVMARYPQGPAFTNEPGVSSNVVGRDAAWFVYGNDHVMPAFSRALLDTFARLQYDSGKVPEYYSALDGHVEDYGLSINDDTPLFILAVNHHWRSTGDVAWLRRTYPAVAKAARYIIAQQDERGLVFCPKGDPRGNVWAITGWRNVIPNYSINGAVTEICAECAAALRAAGHLAQNLERPEAEAQEFFTASRRLRAAMDAHLLNPETGLYYLNLDPEGNAHTDVTGDEIFPVIFRVCSDEVGFRIVSRLNAPDFWTTAGLRTASSADPMYDPYRYVGLIGGVWPGLTWWYAFAAARYHPEFMVRALRSSFEHYAADPRKNNTVPGQFGEWFDGESLINRGMRLSPWEPPRFLWAAVEGVCGLMLSPGLPRINPVLPAEWKWVALRRLPYHGGTLTYFAARHGGHFTIYSDHELETSHHTERYEEDVTASVHAFSASSAVVALRRAGELMVHVGNVGTQSTVVPVDLHELVDGTSRYEARVYSSERGAWLPPRRITGAEAGFHAISIEANGFGAIELRRAP